MLLQCYFPAHTSVFDMAAEWTPEKIASLPQESQDNVRLLFSTIQDCLRYGRQHYLEAQRRLWVNTLGLSAESPERHGKPIDTLFGVLMTVFPNDSELSSARKLAADSLLGTDKVEARNEIINDWFVTFQTYMKKIETESLDLADITAIQEKNVIFGMLGLEKKWNAIHSNPKYKKQIKFIYALFHVLNIVATRIRKTTQNKEDWETFLQEFQPASSELATDAINGYVKFVCGMVSHGHRSDPECLVMIARMIAMQNYICQFYAVALLRAGDPFITESLDERFLKTIQTLTEGFLHLMRAGPDFNESKFMERYLREMYCLCSNNEKPEMLALYKTQITALPKPFDHSDHIYLPSVVIRNEKALNETTY
jgi:hypothetical protein